MILFEKCLENLNQKSQMQLGSVFASLPRRPALWPAKVIIASIFKSGTDAHHPLKLPHTKNSEFHPSFVLGIKCLHWQGTFPHPPSPIQTLGHSSWIFNSPSEEEKQGLTHSLALPHTLLSLEHCFIRARETIQLVQGLVCKQEGPSSIPSTHIKD